jgi:DNA primase
MSILASLVEQDFGIRGNGRWLRAAEHDSLVVDTEKDYFYWNSRNIGGDAFSYLTKVRGLGKKDANKFVSTLAIDTIPKNKEGDVVWDKMSEVFYLNSKLRRDYWYSRCLSDATIDLFRLGYDPEDEFFTIPIFLYGGLFNIQLRKEIPEKTIRMWYRGTGHTLANASILKYTDTIYIAEGMVDMLLMNQEGFPSTCTTGGAGFWDRKFFPWFRNIKKIYVLYDNDKAGRNGAKKISKELGEYRTFIFTFWDMGKEGYDIVDWFRGGHTKEELKLHIEKEAKQGFLL